MKQLQEAIAEKSKLVGQVFAEAGDDIDFSKVKCIPGDTAAKVAALKALNDELSDMHKDWGEYNALVKSRKLADETAGFKGEDIRETLGDTAHAKRSLGEQFIKSEAYLKKGAESHLDIDLKTIVRTGSGWSAENMRLPRVELYPLRTLRVADVFPTYPTGLSSIKYMEETTHTNNAAEIAEETNAAAPTAYGEAALVMTERTVPVEKVAIWIPVTEEQLSDVEGIQQFIEDRLTYMVRNRLDGQLIAGNGNTPSLRGVLNAANLQTQALGGDPVPDAVLKAMTKVRGVTAGTGFGEPSAVIFHPNDHQALALLRTADGIYIFGNPTDAGPKQIWGVPIIVTPAETENTAVVGDFTNYAALYVRNGIDIQISNSHASLFTSGVLAIKATMRCSAVYFRGSAFCQVTGI
jgi:HK97 family phage major capsid protein